MAFLCDDCHSQAGCDKGWIENFHRSYGRCEGCGYGAPCLDCHGYTTIPSNPTVGIVEALRREHWLMFKTPESAANGGPVVGCACGFPADLEDHGWGDSVVNHIAAVAAAATREDETP